MKPRFTCYVLFSALALWACTTAGTRLEAQTPPSILSTTASQTPPADIPTATTGACYYIWASRELPQLSQIVDTALRGVEPAATGNAYAYGEDCVSPDGTRTFSPLETDFRVRIAVRDLKAHEALGNLIVIVMNVIEEIPEAQLVGLRPGRVELEFYTTTAENLHLEVDIDRYRRQATGLKGAALFRLFYTTP